MQGIKAPPADGSFVPVQGTGSLHATSAASRPMTQPMRPPGQACDVDLSAETPQTQHALCMAVFHTAVHQQWLALWSLSALA